MDIHKNARLKSLRREEKTLAAVEGRLSRAVAARIYGVMVGLGRKRPVSPPLRFPAGN